MLFPRPQYCDGMYQLFYNRTVANTESPREATAATSAVALVASGTVVSHLVSCDGVSAYVTREMSDGANPSPFVDGDVVVITALE